MLSSNEAAEDQEYLRLRQRLEQVRLAKAAKLREVQRLSQRRALMKDQVREVKEEVERQLYGGEQVVFETSDTGELRRRKKAGSLDQELTSSAASV